MNYHAQTLERMLQLLNKEPGVQEGLKKMAQEMSACKYPGECGFRAEDACPFEGAEQQCPLVKAGR